MDVTITRENPILIKVEVNVPWDKVSRPYADALKEMRGTIQIPGFRKGKAPVALLKKRFRQQIISDVAKKVIPESLDEWIKEKDIKAVGSPRLNHMDLKEDDHFHYMAELDVLPEIELREWRGLEVESLILEEMEPEAVEHELKHMLEHASERKVIIDRGAEDGDSVSISLTVLDSAKGEAITDLAEHEIGLGKDDTHPRLATLVKGLRAEDDFDQEYDAPEDDAFEEWRGKKVRLAGEVLEVARISEPELNDDFAKERGAENVDDLRAKVRQNTAKQAQEQETQRMRADLRNKMMEGYTFEVPMSVVEAEARALVESQVMPYMQNFKDRGVPRDLLEQLFRMSIPQAMAKVRSELVLEKVAESLELKAEAEEVDKELEAILPYSEASSLEELRKTLEESGRIDGVGQGILRKKAVEAIEEAATIKKVDQLSSEKQEAVVEEVEPPPAEEAPQADSET